MKTTTLIFVIAVNVTSIIRAQNPVLDDYIRQGVMTNLLLKQQRIGYDKSISEFKEARGMLLPGLSINARYSRAEGGRTITLPMRDIFNGYNMLNNVVNPEINLITPEEFINEEFEFLRSAEHETKLTLAQPLFNAKLYYNIKITKELSIADRKGLEVSTRQLVADIRKAYFNYLKAVDLVTWLNEAKLLSAEFVRVNESLLVNDKVTMDAFYRAKAEDSRIDQEIAEALHHKQVAATYFNYLIGRPSGSLIISIDSFNLQPLFSSLDQVVSSALVNREEIEQLQILQEAAGYNVRMSSANRLPTLIAVADYGFQGEEYRFNGTYDYLLASVVMRWDLFNGFQRREKMRQALLDMQSMETSSEDLRRKIEIEAFDGWYGYLAAQTAMRTSDFEKKAMLQAFEIIKHKYNNGQCSVFEYLDAKTNWSKSVMNGIKIKYDHILAYYNLMRFTAVEQINQYINPTP